MCESKGFSLETVGSSCFQFLVECELNSRAINKLFDEHSIVVQFGQERIDCA